MSGTLAIILGILAGALILIGLGAIWLNRRNGRLPASGYTPSATLRSPEEELNALGILEIKPRAASSKSKKTNEPHAGEVIGEEDIEIIEVAEGDHGLPEEEDGIVTHASPRAAHREKNGVSEEKEAPAELEEDAEEEIFNPKRAGVSRREALFRMLNAVQASVDGYTACLIKREADGRCYVEAIVSQNPSSLGPKSIRMDELLDDDVIEGSAVIVRDIDAGTPAEEVLGYYASPVSIRQVAIVPIKAPGVEEAYFLLVDALSWQDLDDPWQRLMIGQFSTLLGTFMSTPISDANGGEFIKPRVRPRREIIAEEIQRARASHSPLALALIYLNRAEAIADAGGKAISNAERTMANRLELAVNGGRLERFGELTYGIFQDEDVSEVEAWALQLQDELVREGDCFEGGVSIGIALLQDRHKDADDFRADATEALREAYETGACTIIE